VEASGLVAGGFLHLKKGTKTQRKRGLERFAYNRAIKWMTGGKQPNVIKILHSAVR